MPGQARDSLSDREGPPVLIDAACQPSFSEQQFLKDFASDASKFLDPHLQIGLISKLRLLGVSISNDAGFSWLNSNKLRSSSFRTTSLPPPSFHTSGSRCRGRRAERTGGRDSSEDRGNRRPVPGHSQSHVVPESHTWFVILMDVLYRLVQV